MLSACTATEDTQCSKEEKKEKDEGKDKKKDKKKNKDKEEEETAELSILAADEPDVDCGDCPDGKYVSRECNVDKGRGRECSSCEDHCGDGVDKCKDVDGTVECESCNYKSAFPVFVKDEDGDGYGPCSFCTPCGSDQYLEEACEGTKDNVCKDCRSAAPKHAISLPSLLCLLQMGSYFPSHTNEDRSPGSPTCLKTYLGCLTHCCLFTLQRV